MKKRVDKEERYVIPRLWYEVKDMSYGDSGMKNVSYLYECECVLPRLMKNVSDLYECVLPP